MRRLSLLPCLLALVGCGSSTTKNLTSPIYACRTFAGASCTRYSECASGVNVDSCTQLLENVGSCDTASCGTEVYSSAAAQQCLTDIQNQSCSDNLNNTPLASCTPSNICVAP